MNSITQPTGLRAFGWGVLGFFGANLIFAFIAAAGEAVMLQFDFGIGMTVILSSFIVVWYFGKTRELEATRTGAFISLALNIAAFTFGFMGAIA